MRNTYQKPIRETYIPLDDYDYHDIINKTVSNAYTGDMQGFPTGLKGFDSHVGGIHPHDYYVFVGESRTGKSSFIYDKVIFQVADLIFKEVDKLFENGDIDKEEFQKQYWRVRDKTFKKPEDIPLIYDIVVLIKKSIYIRLFSLEIGIMQVMMKDIARMIYYRFNELYSPRYITGAYGIPTDDFKSKIRDFTVDFHVFILKQIFFIETVSDYSKIKDTIKRDNAKIEFIKKDLGGTKDIFYIVMMDHPSLMSDDTNNNDLRLVINAFSKEIINQKKDYYSCGILVQQITPSVESRKDVKYLIPGFENMRDTKNTFTDADIVFAIASPSNKQYDTIKYGNGVYMINPEAAENNGLGLGNRFILGKFAKDRGGDDSGYLAMFFLGEIGVIRDMALPENLTEIDYMTIMNLESADKKTQKGEHCKVLRG